MTDLCTTQLHSLHQELGAKIVAFAGYQMPISYPSGIIHEHRHTRTTVSLFDVSHMGQIRLQGNDATKYLESLSPINFIDLPEGRQTYSYFTNANGGIIDDFIAMKIGSEYRIVVNAANTRIVLAALEGNPDLECNAEILDNYSMISLQGPHASRVLSKFAPKAKDMYFMDTRHLLLDGIHCVVSRSGYTGEDGFEISTPSKYIQDLARKLLEVTDVRPAGLGARDTLRLEAGLCLHGNEIDPETSPVEANIAWAIPSVRRAGGIREGGFPGAKLILSMLEQGSEKLRVGLKVNGPIPVRAKTPLQTKDGRHVGIVTSGNFGPSVGHPIAMAYVDRTVITAGTQLYAIVRNKKLGVTVANLPFVPLRYHRN